MNFGILVYGVGGFAILLATWKVYHYMQDRMRRVRERLRMDEMVTYVARTEKVSDLDFTFIGERVDIPKPKMSKRARRGMSNQFKMSTWSNLQSKLSSHFWIAKKVFSLTLRLMILASKLIKAAKKLKFLLVSPEKLDTVVSLVSSCSIR